MSYNPYKRLLDLIPNAPLQVGDVILIENGVATVQLPGGATTQVRGTTTVGARVFFRDGVVEGAAPALPISIIEI